MRAFLLVNHRFIHKFIHRFTHRFTSGGLALISILFLTNSQAAVEEAAYSDLHWRQVGPFRGGWATAVAGHPDISTTFYFGSADGGD